MSLQSDTLAPATEQEILAVIRSMEQLRRANYITVSTVVFMLYDIIINLKREIPLVWCYGEESNSANPHYQLQLQVQARKVNQVFIRLLFIFSRYYGIFFLTVMFTINNTTGLSTALCKRYYYYLNLTGPALYVTVVNVILAMRIHALNKRNRCCGTFLAFLVVGEFLVDFAVCAVMSVRTAAQVVNPPPWIPWLGCMLASRNTPPLTLASWLTALFISIFCAVTLKNILFAERDNLSLQEMLKQAPRTRVMLYDGVAVYFLTFVIVLVSTVVLSLVQNELSTLVVSLLVGIYSHCASRLILNVRSIESKLCPADVPDDPDSLPPLPFLTQPEHEEQPVASSSRI